MKVELPIDYTKKLPDGAMPVLEKELLKRLRNHLEDCSLIVRRAGSDGLSVYAGANESKKTVEGLLQETWESADDWFY
ncbi:MULTISPECIES: DinI-like family protein [Klebsiella pneumoniae complex]|uniref:DinI-like family protein n=1 Tax=Klebsiella pneumoniae complex TaxID=3390273 RepID=UPI000B9C2821|nr:MULTISPECIES: DinI-like family protein [Klebsiella]UTJ74578.1 DinI family protein [Klebsiella pneumoniae]